jgi:hypothetical protein
MLNRVGERVQTGAMDDRKSGGRRFEIAAQSRSDRLAGDLLCRHISTSHYSVRRCVGKQIASRPIDVHKHAIKHHLECLDGQELMVVALQDPLRLNT